MRHKINTYFPRYSLWIFMVVVVLVSIVYGFHKILPLQPQSLHHWRQTDCLSLTKNYYEEGMNFFSPGVHNQFSTDGKVVSEFPIIYYIVALLWKIFGQHEWIYRLVNVMLMFIGLCCLFRAFERLLKDSVWAGMLALTVFVSPIYVYYSNNFLIDTPALNTAFMGWYFFIRFYDSKRSKFFYAALVLFVLAALLKITAGISLVAIFVAVLAEQSGRITYAGTERLFKKKFIFYLLGGFAVILGWLGWAYYYNQMHQAGGLFLMGLLPIWEMKAAEINDVLRIFFEFILGSYMNINMLALVLVFFGIILVFFKKADRLLLTFLLTVSICAFIYVLFFFQVFNVHDYYLTNMLVFVIMVLLVFFQMLKNHYISILSSTVFKSIFALLIIFNIYITSAKNHLKYFAENVEKTSYSPFLKEKDIALYGYLKADHIKRYQKLSSVTPYLRSLGIKREDKVISIPDETTNASLYYLDQKGHTNFAFPDAVTTEYMDLVMDLGVKYLIIIDSAVKSDTLLQPYLTRKIGNMANVEIYQLK